MAHLDIVRIRAGRELVNHDTRALVTAFGDVGEIADFAVLGVVRPRPMTPPIRLRSRGNAEMWVSFGQQEHCDLKRDVCIYVGRWVGDGNK